MTILIVDPAVMLVMSLVDKSVEMANVCVSAPAQPIVVEDWDVDNCLVIQPTAELVVKLVMGWPDVATVPVSIFHKPAPAVRVTVSVPARMLVAVAVNVFPTSKPTIFRVVLVLPYVPRDSNVVVERVRASCRIPKIAVGVASNVPA